MALTLTQSFNQEISLALTNLYVDTASATFKFASATADGYGFVTKTVTGTTAADYDDIKISAADLSVMFGPNASAALVTSGGLSPLMTVEVKSFKADSSSAGVDLAVLTAVSGDTNDNNKVQWLTFNLPSAPTNVVLTTKNKNYQVTFNVTSDRALTEGTGGNAGKVKVWADLHLTSSDGLGSFSNQIFYATSLAQNGNVYTLEGSGTADALTNGETYEIQMSVSNIGPLNAPQAGPYSAMLQFKPNANPGAPSSVTTATTFATGGALDSNYPVTIDGKWDVGSATGVVAAAIILEEFKNGILVPAHSTTQAISSVDFNALMLAVGSDTALPSMLVPNTFFSVENSIKVRLRMKVTKDDGSIKMGNYTTDIDIFKTILPTMSDLSIRLSVTDPVTNVTTPGVNAAGDQVIVGSFESAGPGIIEHTYTKLGAASAALALTDGAYEVTAAFAPIDNAAIKTVSIKIELTDPNATSVNGNVVKYAVEKSISLKAFKLPTNVIINAIAGACNAAPSYDFELGAANGNTISGYTVTAEFQGAGLTTAQDSEGDTIVFSSPNPYEVTKTFVEANTLALAHTNDGSVTLATSNTGSSYTPGPYKIKVVTNFTADLTPAETIQYANTYAMSLSADSADVLFFGQPTLTSVSSFEKTLTIVGNSQGANMTGASAVSAVTFSGATAGEYSMQTMSAASGLLHTGNTAPTNLAGKYAFSKVFTFASNIADLNNIGLDGIVILDPSDAPSTMRMLNFNDNSVALTAAQTAQAFNTQMVLDNTAYATLSGLVADAQTALNDAIVANSAPQLALTSANTVATTATNAQAAANAADAAAAQTAADALTANNSAQTAIDSANVDLNGQPEVTDGDGNITQAAVVGAAPAHTAAAAAATAAQNIYDTALVAYNAGITAQTATDLVTADGALTAANAAAAIALADKNTAQAALDAANVVKIGQPEIEVNGVITQPYVEGTAATLTSANTAATTAATALTAANDAKSLAQAAAAAAAAAAVNPAQAVVDAQTALTTAQTDLTLHGALVTDNDDLDADGHIAAVAAAGIKTSVLSQ